ncbi:MAG TPA: geranylgeranyl reductase family protein [Pseudolabrys sp.]
MPTEKYDAVVVGGGPGGSAAAYTLAAAGKKVCLIDKSEFPRDKLCGGGLTFRSKRAFEQIFKRRWKSELINSSQNVSFFSKGRFLASYKVDANIYFTMRLSFDHYLVGLAQEAGATLKLGDAVSEIDLEKNSIVLRSGEQISFGFLIGADGVNSVVAKTLYGQSFNPETIAFALEAEVPRDRLPQHGDLVEFDFSAARWGYAWVFPKQKSITIGIGGLHRLNPDLRSRLDWYLRRKGLDSREFKVKGQYLPAGDYRVIPGRSNVLLCGDAAGAVDPISGEGIPFAMQTGAAAGRAVATVLSQPAGRSALEIYCDDWKIVVASLRASKFWRWFIYPRLSERLFAWVFGCEAIRKRILVEPARHTRLT